MSEIVSLDLSRDRDSGLWQRFLDKVTEPHYSDDYRWRIFFRELYGIENHTFIYRGDTGIEGGASLYYVKSPFFGNMLVTSPFFGYGGFYAFTSKAEQQLLDHIFEMGKRSGIDFIEIRSCQRLPAPYEFHNLYGECDLELNQDPEIVWKESLTSNARQNVRKSKKQNIHFRITREYEPCYQLLSRTIRDLGTPFHNHRFFELVLEHFPEESYFAEAILGGETVAAAFVFKKGESISTPYIGSLKKYRPLRVNYFLYWSIIEWSCRVGCKRFELGRSPRGSTHEKFKKKWGARVRPVFYNYLVLNSSKAYKTTASPSTIQVAATRVWQHLPLWMTRRLGHRLFRYIP